MKKFTQLLLIAVLLIGCSATKTKNKAFNVLCPSGAPTLAFLSSYKDIVADGKFDVVEGSDQLVAELSKSDSEYDVIVAPINLGANLISKGKTDYRLHGIVTWGNLYLVGTKDALNQQGDILLFGEGAVPSKIYEACQIDTKLKPVYMGEASLVSADLVSGKASVGMLAEPLASATMAKAKKQNINLEVLADLQEVYATKQSNGESGYPQAAVFVKKSMDISWLEENLTAYTQDMSEAATYLDDIGVETLGLPAKEMVIASLEKQNVKYRKASEVKAELTQFLALFGIDFSDEMLDD